MCSTNTHRSTGKFNGERDGPGKQTKRPFGQSRKDFMCREYPNDGKLRCFPSVPDVPDYRIKASVKSTVKKNKHVAKVRHTNY